MHPHISLQPKQSVIDLPCELTPSPDAKKYPKILCSIPSYHSVDPRPFIHFLIMAQEAGLAEAKGRWGMRFNVPGPKIRTIPARQSAADFAVNCEATHLLFIDDDMLVLSGMVDRLLKHDVDIVAPLFFGASKRPLVFDLDSSFNPVPMFNYPRNALFEAPGGVGTGVMLIKTSVLHAMDPPYFRVSLDPRIGEDIGFCLRAMDLGFKAWCDSSITIDQMGIPEPMPRGD